MENANTYEQMGQFTKIPFAFIEGAKDLSWHARWLYVTLLYHRNGKSGVAFPSYERISELTGMRREMISKSIVQLERSGWVRKRRRYANSNVYRLEFTTKGIESSGEIEPNAKSMPASTV
jgi:DNA-binding MarR family transcriptional regulator